MKIKRMFIVLLGFVFCRCTSDVSVPANTYKIGQKLVITNVETNYVDTVVIRGIGEYYLLLDNNGVSYEKLCNEYTINKIEK